MPLVDVINDPNSDIALLWLITVTDPSSNLVLRGVSNLEDVTSRGDVYTAFPFMVELPPDDGVKPNNLVIKTGNFSDDLVRVLRQTESPPSVKLELVLSSNPNAVEKTLDFFVVSDATYTARTIDFELANASIFNRKTVTGSFNQFEFPALFWAMGSS